MATTEVVYRKTQWKISYFDLCKYCVLPQLSFLDVGKKV